MGGSTAEIPAQEVIQSDISDSDLTNWTISLLSVWKGKQLITMGTSSGPAWFLFLFHPSRLGFDIPDVHIPQ